MKSTSMKTALFMLFFVFIIFVGAFIFLGTATDVHAQFNPFSGDQLVPCGGTNDPTTAIDESADCGICHARILATNVMSILAYLAVMVAVLMFVYAGFLYVTGAANPGNIEKAHKIFWAVLMGLFITLGSWLIVDTVMKGFYIGEDNKNGFGPWNDIKCVIPPAAPPVVSPGGGGVVVVPPAVTDNICYEQTEKFLKLTTSGDYEECVSGSGCSRKSIAISKGTYSSNSECVSNCSSPDVCSDPASLKSSNPTVLVDPTITTAPTAPSITASISANGIQDKVSVIRGGRIEIAWNVTPRSDADNCVGTGPRFDTGGRISGRERVDPGIGVHKYEVICESNKGPTGLITTSSKSVTVTVTGPGGPGVSGWCFESCNNSGWGLCFFTKKDECSVSGTPWDKAECSSAESTYNVAGRKVNNSCEEK